MTLNIDKTIWNNFISQSPGGSFLQSWEWGAMQEKLGVPYWRLTIGEGGTVNGVALVIQRQLPWGKSWLYIPKGPLWVNPKAQKPNSKLLEEIIALAQRERVVFVRIEPAEIPGEGWRKAPNDVQPRHTLVLNLQKSDDELLGEMHQKTRYNIRLAGKKGVQVRFSTDAKDLDYFIALSSDVHDRSAFRYHPENYYRAILQTLQGEARAEIALAEHEGDVLVVHLLVYFGGVATYVHGASKSTKRELMAPHLLQWESIKRARGKGCTTYDFFGVAPPQADSLHSWQGITKFKEGFGGQRVSYPGAFDYVLDPFWYWTYGTGRKLNSFLR